MGLQKVQKQEVVTVWSSGIPDGAIGNADLTAALFEVDRRTIAGEVKEIPWPDQFPQFPSSKVGLQMRQQQGSDVSYVDPGLQNSQGMRLPELRNRLIQSKGTQPHGYILSRKGRAGKISPKTRFALGFRSRIARFPWGNHSFQILLAIQKVFTNSCQDVMPMATP